MTQIGRKLWVIGGMKTIFEPNAKTFSYNLDSESFVEETIKGTAPQGRFYHCAAPYEKKIFIFGGVGRGQDKKQLVHYNELYSFNTEINTYTLEKSTGVAPAVTQGHSCLVLGDKMYLFGGILNDGATLNDFTFSLDLKTKEWTKLHIQTKARAFQTVTLIDKHAIIFGGKDNTSPISDVRTIDLMQNTQVYPNHVGGVIHARLGHCAIAHEGKVLIFGGSFDWKKKFKDIAFIDVDPSKTKIQKEKQAKVELSDQIEKLILQIQIRKGEDETIKKTGSAISELLNNNIKEKQLLSEVAGKIKVWDDINVLYKEMFSILSSLDNGTSTLEFDNNGFESLFKETKTAKDLLLQNAETLKSKLAALKAAEQERTLAVTATESAQVMFDQEVKRQETLEDEIKTTTHRRTTLQEQTTRDKLNQGRLVLDLQKLQENNVMQDTFRNQTEARANLLDEQLVYLKEQITKVEGTYKTMNELIEKVNADLSQTRHKLKLVDQASQKNQELREERENVLRTRQTLASKEQEVWILLGVEEQKAKTQSAEEADRASQMIAVKRDQFRKLEKEQETQMTKLTGDITNLRNQLNSLKDNSTNIEKELEGIKHQTGKASETLTAQQREKNDKERELAELIKRIDDAGLEIRRLTDELDVSHKDIARIQTNIELRRSELEKAKARATTATSSLDKMKQDLKKEFDSLEHADEEYLINHEKLETTRRNIEATKNAYNTQHARFEELRKKLVETLMTVDYQSKFAQLEKTISDKDAEIAQLKSALEATRKPVESKK